LSDAQYRHPLKVINLQNFERSCGCELVVDPIKPAWLNKEFYVQKIQPQLKRLRVKKLLRLCRSPNLYTAFIRSGRRIPHQRHWQVLARLVGVSDPL
jgi:hypothetical protein